MSFFTLINGMIIGIFLFTGIFSLVLALRKIEVKINLSFFAFAFSIGLSILFNTLYLKTSLISEFVYYSKISANFLALAGIAFIYLISYISGYQRISLRSVIVAYLIILMAVNYLSEFSFTWSEVTAMQPTYLPWGEKIFNPEGTVSIVLYASIIVIILIFIYSYLAIKHLIDKVDKARGNFLLATIAVGVSGLLINQIALMFDIQLIITDELGYTAFVVLISYINFKSVVVSAEMKRELKKNEIKFRTLYENAGDGIMLIHNGKFFDCNAKALELFDCKKEYIIGKTPAELSPTTQPDGSPSDTLAENIVLEALQGNEKEFEWIHQRENGETFFAQINLNQYTLSGEEYLQARVRDISENKEIINQLRVSEYRFRTLVEGMNEAVIQVDNDDRIVFVNEKFTEVMGYTLAEIKGKIGYELFLTPDEYDTIRKLNKQREEGVKNQYEIRFLNKRGEKVDLLISGTPVYDFDGKVTGSFGVMTDITERKKAEEAVKLSEEKFRSFIEQSTNGFVLVDKEGRIIEFNEAQEKLTGMKKHEVIGEFIWDIQLKLLDPDFIPREDAEKLIQRVKKLIKDARYQKRFIERIKPTEIRIDNPNNQKLVILQSVFPVETGSDFYIGSMYIDITERKASEEALMRERRNFRRVFEDAPIAMQIVDMEPPFERVLVNDAYAKFFGISKNELIKISLTDNVQRSILDENTLSEMREIYLENGMVENYHADIRTYQNENKKVLITIKPIIFNEKRYNLNVIQDISEIESAQQELQFALDYLQFIVDSIQSVIIAVDKDLKVTHYNKASLKFNGSDSDEVYIFDKFPKLKFIKDTLLDTVNDESDVDNISKTIVHKNGDTEHFQLSISRIKNRQRPGYVILLEDISDRKKMDDLMIQSEKMLSVAGLAAGMAHEINNPLGTIVQGCQNIIRRTSKSLPKNLEMAKQIGFSLDMLETYMERRQVYDIIESMRSAASKASDIIKNMLQFSRRSESKKVLYNIIRLVNDALELAYNDYDMKKKFDIRSIEIIKEFPESIPDVKLTVTEIEQVIFNILRNAAQALHEENNTDKVPRIIFRIYREKNNAVVEIEDNGPGMPDEVKNRVFEPFYTTKEVGEGTGLGLSVSYMIIKNNHNGILTVRSEEGIGSNFIIKLPISEE